MLGCPSKSSTGSNIFEHSTSVHHSHVLGILANIPNYMCTILSNGSHYSKTTVNIQHTQTVALDGEGPWSRAWWILLLGLVNLIVFVNRLMCWSSFDTDVLFDSYSNMFEYAYVWISSRFVHFCSDGLNARASKEGHACCTLPVDSNPELIETQDGMPATFAWQARFL